MMERHDYEEELHTFFEHIPERFIVTEEELDRKTYDLYLQYSQNIAPPYDYGRLLQESEQLFDHMTPVSRKQELLTQLAQCETVKAYRIIEQYHHHPEPELAQWSKIALYECRMRLESDLLEKQIGLISTGLGGKGHRVRYCVVLGLRDMGLQEHEQPRIERIWQQTCERHDSQFEHIQCYPSYLMIRVLVSMDVAVGTVIEESLTRINQENDKVYHDYFVTNVSLPTEEEIHAFLKQLSP